MSDVSPDVRATRKQLSKTLRFEIFKRDEFTCQYCGQKPPAVVLQIDHVLAVASGGSSERHNLITACFDCNVGKGAKTLAAAPFDVKQRTADIKERRAQIKAYETMLKKERDQIDSDIDWVLDIFLSCCGSDGLPNTARQSIRYFLTKLPSIEVRHAMELATGRRLVTGTWRYFCGVCWRKIKQPSPCLRG